MSGLMPTALADAASTYALRAEAAASGLSLGRLIQRRAMAKLVRRAEDAKNSESLPGRTWRAMDLRTRTVLVMLASEHAGDPRAYASKAWESLTEADQVAIGACARQLRESLAGATCLF